MLLAFGTVCYMCVWFIICICFYLVITQLIVLKAAINIHVFVFL